MTTESCKNGTTSSRINFSGYVELSDIVVLFYLMIEMLLL